MADQYSGLPQAGMIKIPKCGSAVKTDCLEFRGDLKVQVGVLNFGQLSLPVWHLSNHDGVRISAESQNPHSLTLTPFKVGPTEKRT